MDNRLLIQRNDGVTRLILNRSDKANALDATFVEEILAAIENAYGDGTRLLIFSGNGSSFSAGFDFTEMESENDATLAIRLIRIETMLQAVHHAPFVTLALAHGGVFGAGADLVCACTRRIAAPKTRFRMPGLGFGVVLGTQRFAERVGPETARSILSETRMFDAEEALRIGFIETILEPESWPVAIQSASNAAAVLDRISLRTLHDLTTCDMRAVDMMALVRSVTRPGLKERMVRYRAGTAKQRS